MKAHHIHFLCELLKMAKEDEKAGHIIKLLMVDKYNIYSYGEIGENPEYDLNVLISESLEGLNRIKDIILKSHDSGTGRLEFTLLPEINISMNSKCRDKKNNK